jgi:hypothetical protein
MVRCAYLGADQRLLCGFPAPHACLFCLGDPVSQRMSRRILDGQYEPGEHPKRSLGVEHAGCFSDRWSVQLATTVLKRVDRVDRSIPLRVIVEPDGDRRSSLGTGRRLLAGRIW